MAALHIIPINGTQVPPKVLALIRQWAAVMYAAEIPTYGFIADGYDVYLRQMGGAIQAIVQGDSPYMLVIKIEGVTKTLSHSVINNDGNVIDGGGTWSGPECAYRVTSPVETEWKLVDEYWGFNWGKADVDVAVDGCFYICGRNPFFGNVAGTTQSSSDYGNQVTWYYYRDLRPDTYYTAIGGNVACELHETISGGGNSVAIKAENETPTVIMIRFGDLEGMKSADEKKISVEVAINWRYEQYNESALPMSGSVKCTAEAWSPPEKNPKSFYPHVAVKESDWIFPINSKLIMPHLPKEEIPVIDNKKTLTVDKTISSDGKVWSGSEAGGSFAAKSIGTFTFDLSKGSWDFAPK